MTLATAARSGKKKQRFYRKVIHIQATDSPNVQYGLMQKRAGCKPDDRVIIPGVLTYGEFRKRLKTWDKIRLCIGIMGRFYKGAEQLLFPPLWLDGAAQWAEELRGPRFFTKPRRAETIGVDVGEGVANTSMVAIDRYGIIELQAEKTPDTNVIIGKVIAFGQRHLVPSQRWYLDSGGGGKQLADRMRAKGFNPATVYFGERITPDIKRRGAMSTMAQRIEQKEERFTYLNRRAQMFHLIRLLIDPTNELNPHLFGIPEEYTELRQELAPIPLSYDDEGRIYVLPKNKKDKNAEDKGKTLVELIGHSPDNADALALAVYGMLHRSEIVTAGPATDR